MERVAQGTLPSTIFQDHFPTFAGAHAAEFTKRFAEVGSKFLSNLVRLGSSYPQQSADTAAAEPEINPPHFDASNPAHWYEQVAEYAGQLNARAVKAYRSQLDRVAAGETTPSEVQQQASDRMAKQLPDYMERIAQIYFDLLSELNEVRAAYEEAYFRGLLAHSKTDNTDPIVTLTLSGPAGTTANVALAVTNTTGQRASISHQVSEVRRLDGVGPSFVPAIAFAPDNLVISPGEEATFAVSLELDPQKFDIDTLYKGALLLTGSSNEPLHVQLRILVTSDSSIRSNG